MFKLLKELAKAPEPLLSASGSHSPYSAHSSDGGDFSHLAYKPRSRSGTLQQSQAQNGSSWSRGHSRQGSSAQDGGAGAKEVPPAEETDVDAIRVVQLLAGLKMAKGLMDHVEAFSQILSIKGKTESRRAFRRHGGFKLLVHTLGDGLEWKPAEKGEDQDFYQVKEVQRMEGVRLAFEVLAWAQGDRESSAHFERAGGYSALLSRLYTLSPSPSSATQPTAEASTSTPSEPASTRPTSAILSVLFAHILNNNYTILSLFNESISRTEITEKLGEPTLKWPACLPLLLSYLWGLSTVLDDKTNSIKGKEKASTISRATRAAAAGHYEAEDSELLRLVETTFHILSIALSSSTSNLFLIYSSLPDLPNYLGARLFGPEEPRHYEATFNSRYDWAPKDEGEEEEPEMEWCEPSAGLREIYLKMLRRMLEAGVSREMTWRLYGLVRRETNVPTRRKSSTKSATSENNGGHAEQPLGAMLPPKSTERRKGPGSLKLDLPTGEPEVQERLNAEVLDLLRHAMRSRWPSIFVFSGGQGEEAGGLELRDMGRAWPKADRGINFTSWLYISKMDHAITLLSCSQSVSQFPFLQVKILENSLISISTSSKPGPITVEPEEIVCQAPDALVPHGQWVHFGMNMRQPKGSDIGEVRLYINGARVGVMRLPYPIVVPPVQATAPLLGQRQAIAPEAIRVSVARSWGGAVSAQEMVQDPPVGKSEDNEWLLGRVLFLEDAIPEDIVLLMYHLGPRYTGNLQEPLGKFLTYSAATSINIYLHSLARESKDKRLFAQSATTILVKAIRTGTAIVEENIILSLSAKDAQSSNSLYRSDQCANGGIPSASRAKQLRHGYVRLEGRVDPLSISNLDETTSAVGGGTVLLKMVDMAQTTEELVSCLGILRDMITDNWTGSEEMERIHGFDLLAAILRPKMATLVDIHCAKIILNMLGIHSDNIDSASVCNSVAYRALGLDFELWSSAPLEVVSVYLQHFEYLLVTSKHSRYNILRTFQKSAKVKKILFALRSGFYETSAIQMVIDTLVLAMSARWSAEEAIKPTFSYLITALCQSTLLPGSTSLTEIPSSQLAAALVLSSIADLITDDQRLIKLNRAIALHRLLVIFISSNSAYYVILPCLRILKQCLITPGLESFQRSFEAEGGFALLGRTLGPIWREDIQELVFDTLVNPEQRDGPLVCSAMVPVLTAALEILLAAAGETEDTGRPTHTRSRSGTVTSVRSITITPLVPASDPMKENDDRLRSLLTSAAALYRDSPAFRRAISTKRVEAMLPYFADFAAVSGSSGKPGAADQRQAAAEWLSAILDLAKSKLPNAITEQITLVREQLTTVPVSSRSSSPGGPTSPISPVASSIPRPASTSYFGTSISSRMGPSPSVFEPLRRRPSTEATLVRMRGSFERRIPLTRQLTGESVLETGKDKNAAWKLIIIQTDLQSHGKMTLERKEHWKRLGQHDWPKQASQLWQENGLWPVNDQPVLWRLDGSEGPLRMRNRLERINAAPDAGIIRTRARIRDAIPSVDELSSAVSRINMAPWEDPFALAPGEASSIAEEEPAPTLSGVEAEPVQVVTPAVEAADDDSFVEVEEAKDDKMRRIAKTLQAGDVVEQAHNIVRIVGVDACPGLLIFGRKNMYLIDSLVYTAEGEVIDAKDAPKDILSIPSGTLVELDPADQLSLRWSYTEIVECNKRAFLFRDVALELYFSDKRNFLVVCKDQRERQLVVSKLLSKDEHRDAISRSVIGNFVLDTVARATDRAEQQLAIMTKKWQSREISNFAYLQLLNQHANRTPNDVTQYPVFPWVLADYTSTHLELEKETTFRNLTLPMGALTPARKEAAEERYSATEGVGEKPFHYGTHYSSSMIVCGFMIRMSPFTEIFLALQGGNFDLADRLFSSIPRAWDSASSDNRGDVRELVPEFYYTPAFLMNINHHDFGKKQGTNEVVNDVALPPWALDDPLLFIHRHREALESDAVSRHLATWIDLTFGYKQRDPLSYNCFHPLSYRGAVDLERMSDASEKAASTAIIHNFGQTPVQIFKLQHPPRFISSRSELPIGVRFGVAEQWELLMRSIIPITETTTPIDHVYALGGTDEHKPSTLQRCRLPVPGHHLLSVQYGFTDESIRIYYQENISRLVYLIEGIDVQHAVFAHPTLLITVSSLSTISAWRLTIKGQGGRKGDVSLHREATLRGTTGKITCLTASKGWSMVVAGCDDGSATVWDMNRLRYIRTIRLPRKESIRFASVHESDGMIALATAHHIYLHSLNGFPIASVWIEENALPRFSFGQSSDAPPPPIPEYTGGITFLNREFLRFGNLFVIGIGSELALYRCVPGSKLFGHEEGVKPWSLVEQGRLSRSDEHPGGDCTMVKFIGETLYAGFKPAEDSNKHLLYQWTLPEGHARHVPDHYTHTCMADRCGRHFGLLEPRRHCGGCGGAFCGTHAVHVESMEKRYCESCRSQLSYASAIGLMSNRRDSANISSRRNSMTGNSRPGSRRNSLIPSGGTGSRRPSISGGTPTRPSGFSSSGIIPTHM